MAYLDSLLDVELSVGTTRTWIASLDGCKVQCGRLRIRKGFIVFVEGEGGIEEVNNVCGLLEQRRE